MLFKTPVLLASTLACQVAATCLNPEPSTRICYNSQGATPQNIVVKDLQYTIKMLRHNAQQDGNSKFLTMKVADADNCAEWSIFTSGSVLLLAKLVGDKDASVTYNDVANTLDGGSDANTANSILGCDTAGGQMGVAVNATEPLYQSPDFLKGGFVNTGIIMKVVHAP